MTAPLDAAQVQAFEDDGAVLVDLRLSLDLLDKAEAAWDRLDKAGDTTPHSWWGCGRRNGHQRYAGASGSDGHRRSLPVPVYVGRVRLEVGLRPAASKRRRITHKEGLLRSRTFRISWHDSLLGRWYE